jgi:pimeloyl-ACP methyl ester carboxylesterase
LVHGLGHWTQACWDRVAARLEATRRLVAFDLPGFGQSSRPDGRYDLRFFSATLGAVIKACGLRRYTLAGHSLGGLIAADYASNHAAELERLVLIDPAGFLRTPHLLLRIVASKPVSNLFTLKPSNGFVRNQLERSVYDKRSLDPETVTQAYELAADPLMRRAFARVYSDALSSFLDLPALHARFARYTGAASLVWGRNDRYIPIRALANARAVYPQAGVTVIDRCGHCPPIEYPDEVVAILR